eukprot:8688721-Karenia_brevis.AAC.1
MQTRSSSYVSSAGRSACDPTCADFLLMAAAARDRLPHLVEVRKEQMLAICDIPRRRLLPSPFSLSPLELSPDDEEDQGVMIPECSHGIED